MAAYALAHLRDVRMGPPIVEYLERIDATLAPFGGHFIVHGGELDVVEGSWPGHLVIIEFPDKEAARSWYRSPAYQDILRLRTDNADCDTLIAEGVGRDHRATDVLKA